MPPSLPPALRPQHFNLLAQPRKVGVAGPRPCHDYNVAAARCPCHQGSDQLAQPALDSIPDDGVPQLAADGQADPRPAQLIIAYEHREVVGSGSPAGAQRPIEVGRAEEPGMALQRPRTGATERAGWLSASADSGPCDGGL